MNLDDDHCYRALCARDSRFDGVFFVAVTTTGVYCRPVCTARAPGRDRCRFFSTAALAERNGFRPCLRCRPELAPGKAPIDQVRTIAWAAAARIEAGALADGAGLSELAASLGVGERQLRRAVRKELGASPVELAQTNRLLLAKRLIAETRLPMVQVAFAAGFESVRRFNSLFRSRYRLTPSDLRRSSAKTDDADRLRLTLAYRPPLAWESLLRFLAGRAIPGVECVEGGAYQRTIGIGQRRGVLRVVPIAGKAALCVELSTELAPALPQILARLRSLFDLDARPDVVAAHLALDPRLAESVQRRPGLRLPGAFDPFELALRTILGQQVSVRGASTLAGRFAERLGEPLPSNNEKGCLNRLTPTAERIAAAPVDELAALGVPKTRAECISTLARAVAAGAVDLEPGIDPAAAVEKLQTIPGIGPWTAEYIAMRALRWPDAFPSGDLVLRKAFSSASTKSLEAAAETWRPWRAYAAMHLWQSLHDSDGGVPPV